MILQHQSAVETSLLVVHQGALGDFIVTFPVLRALRVSFSKIDGICRSSFGQLAVDLDVLNGYFPIESARVASLYTNRIDSALSQLLSSYHIIVLISFSKTLEHSIKKINASRVYRIEPWPEGIPNVQVTEFIAGQVIKYGILSPADRVKYVRAFYSAIKGKGTKLTKGATVILSPGAGSRRKRWPMENFLAVSAELIARGLRPVMLLGPAEADIEALLKQRAPIPPDWVKCTSFRELLALFDTAGGYIGNDSGISHLAAFLGIPTVVIFGPSDAVRWRPSGTNVRVVAPPESCRSDTDATCAGVSGQDIFSQITPDRVLTEMSSAFGLVL